SNILTVIHFYLKKIIKALVKVGFVNYSTGINGGFSLNKPLNQITFYGVFLAIEGGDASFSSEQLLKPFLGENGGEKAEMCV
ncbi:Rrf2 family transcriptional regulator, partial [Staphylococcus sp. SIMBA_130]